jgi:hypothetical protein
MNNELPSNRAGGWSRKPATAYEDAPERTFYTGNDRKAMPKKKEGSKNDSGERHKIKSKGAICGKSK